jgi:hypothetical protein
MPSIFSASLAGVCLWALASPVLAQTVADAPVVQPITVAQNSSSAPVSDQASSGGFFAHFMDYYAHEWGKAGPDSDPSAPAARRDYFPPQPETTPPVPFTEWPYGAATALGANRPNSVDSPLMTALAPTVLGRAMQDAHIQAYGWVSVGGNWSTNHVKGGNAPGAYDFDPRNVQLDQAVLYVERTPDTVQRDHIDWGFRTSIMYGTDYRYTTSYGAVSNQLLGRNRKNGYDFPMMYGEVYLPKVAQGLLIRAGRFISVPDIEAQLAPNNYMYSHSLGYTFDAFTNTGVVATLAATKNLFLQAGIVGGSDTAIWNVGKRIDNPFPNALYPHATYLKDPGAKPSFTGCIRYQSDSARDNIYVCVNGINGGQYGYNNLQWYGTTYYHKFSDKLHVAIEIYDLYQKNVPNVDNPTVTNIIANGGSPFSPQNIPFNAPNGAHCGNATALKCTASAQAAISYLNYQISPLNNLTLRTEYYNDDKGQRTGTKTDYIEVGVGLQHFFSPQFEIRPEVTYYAALQNAAFNGNSNLGIAPDKYHSLVVSGDVVMHF